jgi:hypothetical protein
VNDIGILQFALMLEIQQTLFYKKAFSQFSVEEMLSVGLSESQIIELNNAAIIEQIHVDTIVSVLSSLGQKPLNQPKFFFEFASPVDFIEILAVQEIVGTGAYLGAAPFVESKDILSAAASILAIEARQSSFVNTILGNNAFSAAFETSLSIEQVVTIVAPFIVDVPEGTILQALGFSSQTLGLSQISLSLFEEVEVEATLNFSFQGGQKIEYPSGKNKLFCAYTHAGKSSFTEFVPSKGCKVSESLSPANVVLVQITVSESIALSESVTAPHIIIIV